MSNERVSRVEQITAYEVQVLIGTTISGCTMPLDRNFDLKAAWARLHDLGLIDRADGLAIATSKGVDRVAELQQRRASVVTPELVERAVKAFWAGENGDGKGAVSMRAALTAALSVSHETGDGETEYHQQRVAAWMEECFGPKIMMDKVERADRFIEEALELAQATGWTADRGHALVDYVFGRPVGEIGQEVGGVMVTLAALCNVFEIDMNAEARHEVDRITQPDIVLKIRAKQASKPTGSALPAPDETQGVKRGLGAMHTVLQRWRDEDHEDTTALTREQVIEIIEEHRSSLTQLEAVENRADVAERERDEAIAANYRQAGCIHQCAAHLGPDASGTIDGLPLAVKAAITRAEAAEASLAAVREALERAAYVPGDHPIVPIKIAAFMVEARAALAGENGR